MAHVPSQPMTSTSIMQLDPDHISCIGGRTVVTCRNCAGNAPRGEICPSCNGRGFNIYTCLHCHPSAMAMTYTPSKYSSSGTNTKTDIDIGTKTGREAAANTSTTSPSLNGSLSKSTTVSGHSSRSRSTRDRGRGGIRQWRRSGDGRGGVGYGDV